MSDEDCEHYNAQVAVEITELGAKARFCDWCGNPASYELEKSGRYSLYLCEEGTTLLDVLLSGGDGE